MLALISQAALNFHSCCKVASCRKRAREPPPSSGACKQLWNSSYAAMLGQEPRMKHTFEREKKHPAVEMMSIWHPLLLLSSPTQPCPASSCSRNCGDGFHGVWVLYISRKPCHPLKDILFLGGDSPSNTTVTSKLVLL